MAVVLAQGPRIYSDEELLESGDNNELPLYQTIIVTDLVWLANYAIFMALPTYNRHPHGSHAVQYTAIGQMYFDKTGGETVLVVLFKKTSATGAGRVLALVVIAVLLVDTPSSRRSSSRAASRAPSSRERRCRTPTRLQPSLRRDPHLITLGLFILVPYVITVGSTELQIRKNQLCLGNVFWGFGQILAITVTIVPVFGTVQAFRKYGRRQRARDLALSLDIRPYATTNTLQSTSSHINLPDRYPPVSSQTTETFERMNDARRSPSHSKPLPSPATLPLNLPESPNLPTHL
ncbi:hypothetical protein B0H14DRAFT_3863820 [Mycena olivaceomarginata]|nr:hypothetical protein B0H14DRAFT_3863820 [Mycena olivaceomarginata]